MAACRATRACHIPTLHSPAPRKKNRPQFPEDGFLCATWHRRFLALLAVLLGTVSANTTLGDEITFTIILHIKELLEIL